MALKPHPPQHKPRVHNAAESAIILTLIVEVTHLALAAAALIVCLFILVAFRDAIESDRRDDR